MFWICQLEIAIAMSLIIAWLLWKVKELRSELRAEISLVENTANLRMSSIDIRAHELKVKIGFLSEVRLNGIDERIQEITNELNFLKGVHHGATTRQMPTIEIKEKRGRKKNLPQAYD